MAPDEHSNFYAAVVDIGSSSIKLLIAEKKEAEIRIIEQLKNIVPIGNDTFYRERITQKTLDRTVDILNKYRLKIREYPDIKTKVIATTAVREALNKDVFIDTIKRKTGFDVNVLTVGDVIYYIDGYIYDRFKDKYSLHDRNLIVAEIGAGSIDISIMEKGFIVFQRGLPLGTLRIKQLLGKIDESFEENYIAIKNFIKSEFANLRREMQGICIDDIIIIDETHLSDAYIFAEKKGESLVKLEGSQIEGIIEEIESTGTSEIAKKYKISSDMKEIFPYHSFILKSFSDLSENKRIQVFNLPFAQTVIADIFRNFESLPGYNKINHLIAMATAICSKFNADLNHCRHVAFLSELLFNDLCELLGLQQEHLLYLIIAAYLHDIGMFIHNRAHHKHSEYIISCLNLFRLNPEEIKIIACVARYHRKGLPSESHVIYGSLSPDKRLLVQKLSSLLKIANSLDRSHSQKVRDLKTIIENQTVNLYVSVTGNFLLEKSDFADKKHLFEEISGNRIILKIV